MDQMEKYIMMVFRAAATLYSDFTLLGTEFKMKTKLGTIYSSCFLMCFISAPISVLFTYSLVIALLVIARRVQKEQPASSTMSRTFCRIIASLILVYIYGFTGSIFQLVFAWYLIEYITDSMMLQYIKNYIQFQVASYLADLVAGLVAKSYQFSNVSISEEQKGNWKDIINGVASIISDQDGAYKPSVIRCEEDDPLAREPVSDEDMQRVYNMFLNAESYSQSKRSSEDLKKME